MGAFTKFLSCFRPYFRGPKNYDGLPPEQPGENQPKGILVDIARLFGLLAGKEEDDNGDN